MLLSCKECAFLKLGAFSNATNNKAVWKVAEMRSNFLLIVARALTTVAVRLTPPYKQAHIRSEVPSYKGELLVRSKSNLGVRHSELTVGQSLCIFMQSLCRITLPSQVGLWRPSMTRREVTWLVPCASLAHRHVHPLPIAMCIPCDLHSIAMCTPSPCALLAMCFLATCIPCHVRSLRIVHAGVSNVKFLLFVFICYPLVADDCHCINYLHWPENFWSRKSLIWRGMTQRGSVISSLCFPGSSEVLEGSIWKFADVL